jgi:hypothetical protein
MMQRRNLLQCAGGAGFALLTQILRQRMASGNERVIREAKSSQQVAGGFGRAKSVLVVIASGGQSQLETWDPRPDAPSQIRGAFGAISTAVPGTILCDRLPKLARLADRYAIVKSMSHDDLDHGSALYLALTGVYHSRLSSNPPPRETDHPFYGCVLEQQRPATTFLRSSVILNGPAMVPFEPGPGQFAGLLGRQYDSLMIGDMTTEHPALPGLEQLDDVDARRHLKRQRLLSELQRLRVPSSPRTADMETIYQQAFGMLDRPAARQALDLNAEPAKIRDRYGRHRPGQATFDRSGCAAGHRCLESLESRSGSRP